MLGFVKIPPCVLDAFYFQEGKDKQFLLKRVTQLGEEVHHPGYDT